MATTTTNLGLRKPAGADVVNVTTDLSDNFDLIDAKWASTVAIDVNFGGASSAGSSLRVARADHIHGYSAGFGVPVDIVGTANGSGVLSSFARSDHIHKDAHRWVCISESFIVGATIPDFMEFSLPTTPIEVKISAMGYIQAAGVLVTHSHIITSGGGQTVTSGTHSDDHTHSATSGTVSADHTHSVSVTNGGSHSHTQDAHTHTTVTHGHTIIRDNAVGSPPWSVQMNSFGGTNSSGLVQDAAALTMDSQNPAINSTSDHGHSASSGGISANHTHSVTTGGVSSNHTHQVTTTDHSHTTDSQGTGTSVVSTIVPIMTSFVINSNERISNVFGAATIGNSSALWTDHDNDATNYITASGVNRITFTCSTGGKLKLQVWVRF